MDVAELWFIVANFWIIGWYEEQPVRLTKPVVMGGHRGIIVHFDWMESRQVVGVEGRRGLGEADYSRSSLSLRAI